MIINIPEPRFNKDHLENITLSKTRKYPVITSASEYHQFGNIVSNDGEINLVFELSNGDKLRPKRMPVGFHYLFPTQFIKFSKT